MLTYSDMSRRVRHDLLKHLQIPAYGEWIDSDAAQFFLRRVFDANTGICRSCTILGVLFRKNSSWNPNLENAWSVIEKNCASLENYEASLRTGLLDGGIVDEEMLRNLHYLEDSVADFEKLCSSLETGGSAPKIADDFSAALGFFQLDKTNAAEIPSEKPLNILVVDDRLISIDRLQSSRTFQNRFNWVTCCDENIPCMKCPKRAHCELRRARTYSDMLSALNRARRLGRTVDALLLDVRFDDLDPGDLQWIPEIPSVNSVESVRALQGLIIARKFRQLQEFRNVAVVLMTARNRLPEGASMLLEGLDGFQFVDDEASMEAMAARLESIVRMTRESPVEQDYFWGGTPRIQQIRRQIRIMSQGPRTVLIRGPSGSGKSSLVEKIIFPQSGRKNLVTLDLSSIPDTLVESELFGHVKGAYSGATHDRVGLIEEADGGILFLDEIGNLSTENQRKLLLFLQNKMVRRVGASHQSQKKVDVKVIVATHLNLDEEVSAGRFRFDLYMRFGPAMKIELPSLNERKEDLPLFVETLIFKIIHGEEMQPYLDSMKQRTHCGTQVRVEFGKGMHPVRDDEICVRFRPATCELFENYDWPGNTRELESVLDTLILKSFYDLQEASSRSRVIEIDHFHALSLIGGMEARQIPEVNTVSEEKSGSFLTHRVQDFSELRKTLEKNCLEEAYSLCDGDLSRMGELLFGDGSAETKHKIAVRLNQLGLRVREMKKKAVPEKTDLQA